VDEYHTESYWAEIFIRYPYLDRPGMIIAARDLPTNTIELHLADVNVTVLNLTRMELNLATALTVHVAYLNAPDGNPTTIVLKGDWGLDGDINGGQVPGNILIQRDFIEILDEGVDYTLTATTLTLQVHSLAANHTYVIMRVPDLTIPSADVVISDVTTGAIYHEMPPEPKYINEGSTVVIECKVYNRFELPVYQVQVHLAVDDTFVDDTIIPYIDSYGFATTELEWAYVEAGDHIIELYCDFYDTILEKDETNNSVSIPIQINALPVAAFTLSSNTVYTYEPVVIDATASTDSDGTITVYYWQFGDGAELGYDSSASSSVTHFYRDDGRYTIKLEIWDDTVGYASCTREITVKNRIPLIVLNQTFAFDDDYNGDAIYTNLQLRFDASRSYDIDGWIVDYTWEFSTGEIKHGAIVTHQFEDDGVYSVTLSITDDDHAINTTTIEFTVKNQRPIATIRVAPDVYGDIYTTFRFDASASYDPDGTIHEAVWNFGDGTPIVTVLLTAEDTIITHTFSQPGIYNVTLVVVDDDGDFSLPAYLTITITAILTSSMTTPTDAGVDSGTIPDDEYDTIDIEESPDADRFSSRDYTPTLALLTLLLIPILIIILSCTIGLILYAKKKRKRREDSLRERKASLNQLPPSSYHGVEPSPYLGGPFTRWEPIYSIELRRYYR
jgi:PKD repeat protein